MKLSQLTVIITTAKEPLQLPGVAAMAKKVFGLTGNMGCGKSTVAELLKRFPDVIVFDSDQISKDLLREEKHRAKLKDILGPEVFLNSKIDFKKVAALIFKNPGKKKQLETFIHALVWKEIDRRVKNDNTASLFIIESALIYEIGCENRFDAVIVVVCDPQKQRRRLLSQRNMSQKELRERLSQQLPEEEKMRKAQFIIDNSGPLKELQLNAFFLYQALKDYQK